MTVLSGAGISTDSGIPDFRGPNGLWTRDPAAERASTLSHYLADADVRRAAWRNRVRWFERDPLPNAGHEAIVALERRGVLRAVVTQNVEVPPVVPCCVSGSGFGEHPARMRMRTTA